MDDNKTPGVTASARDNVYDGVYGESPPNAMIDVAAIPPNKPRPVEVSSNAAWALGTVPD